MSVPRPIVVFGHRLAPLSRIADVGAALGLTRSTAYRQSAKWPLHGSETSRRVVVPRLLDELGVPYTIEMSDDDDASCS